MDTENDPSFWEWLKELQDQNAHKENVFERLVLELPLPPVPKPTWHRGDPEINSPFDEYDVDTGDIVGEDTIVFQL